MNQQLERLLERNGLQPWSTERTNATELTICEWRIRENYTEAGVAILLAGRLSEIDGKWTVSRTAWVAAQPHRA